MRRLFRRATIAGVGLAAVVLFGTAGCTGTAGGDGGASDAADDPASHLVRAAEELGKTSHKIKVQIGADDLLTGVIDNRKELGHTINTIKRNGRQAKIERLLHGADIYAKADLGGARIPGVKPGKWIHLDIGKLPKDKAAGLRDVRFDPGAAGLFMRAIATVDRVGDGGFTGTLDVSKALGAGGLNQQNVTDMGAKAKAVPFEAATDAEGRLVKLVVKMPPIGKSPALPMTATYSGFGTRVEVARPAASEVTEAPAGLLENLTS